jgi:hypothetical protein
LVSEKLEHANISEFASLQPYPQVSAEQRIGLILTATQNNLGSAGRGISIAFPSLQGAYK